MPTNKIDYERLKKLGIEVEEEKIPPPPFLAESAPVHSLLIDEQKQHVVAAGKNFISVWDVKSQKKLKTAPLDFVAGPMIFSTDAKSVLIGEAEGAGRIFVVSLESLKKIHELSHNKAAITALVLIKEEMKFLSAAADGLIVVWDLADWQPKNLAAHKGAVNALLLSADQKRFYSAGADKKVLEWNLATGEHKELFAFPEQVWAMEHMAANSGLLIGGESTFAMCPFKEELVKINVHDKPIRKIILEMSGEFAFTCSMDGTIALVELTLKEVVGKYDYHKGPVYDILAVDGVGLISAGEDGQIGVNNPPEESPFVIDKYRSDYENFDRKLDELEKVNEDLIKEKEKNQKLEEDQEKEKKKLEDLKSQLVHSKSEVEKWKQLSEILNKLNARIGNGEFFKGTVFNRDLVGRNLIWIHGRFEYEIINGPPVKYHMNNDHRLKYAPLDENTYTVCLTYLHNGVSVEGTVKKEDLENPEAIKPKMLKINGLAVEILKLDSLENGVFNGKGKILLAKNDTVEGIITNNAYDRTQNKGMPVTFEGAQTTVDYVDAKGGLQLADTRFLPLGI